MSYNKGSHLPAQSASKLGHLNVVEKEWVKALIEEFESAPINDERNIDTGWKQFDPSKAEILNRVWAVDGSFVSVSSSDKPPREVTFVKTALLTIDKAKIDAVDKDHPHPLQLQEILSDSAIFHATVFPLKNIKTPMGSNYDAIRNIINESIRVDEDGAFFETLKWLSYQKWSKSKINSPAFFCPHCHAEVKGGLPFDAEEGNCPSCTKEVFLTDMLGFHLDMDEESAPDSIASAYMLMMEHLMLFTAVRIFWDHKDQQLVSNTLFIKDGPLTLRSQYSKLIPSIRNFLQHTKEISRPVHIIGQEKSGAFFDHLDFIAKYTAPHERGDQPSYAALTHDYIRKEIYRSPDLKNPYGSRTNWGEKVLIKFDPATYMVINVPTGAYNPAGNFPNKDDLIGFDRIMTTLPTLISHKHQGALFPIELADGIASMSNYPSAKILQRFLDGS